MPRARIIVVIVVVVGVLVAPGRGHADTIITGTVESAHGVSSGDVIVTEADVVDDAGVRTHVVQLGGVAGGVGMIYSDLPRALVSGERVTLDVVAGKTANGDTAAVLQHVRHRSGGGAPRVIAANGPATSIYGLQTSTAGRTLWRESGCIDVVYDEATVTPEIAAALDQSFGAWVKAVDAAKCGGLSINRSFARGIAAGNDGISTVRVRSTKWCHPATLTSPEICYPDAVAAVTRLIYIDTPGSAGDGEIQEADMEINNVTFNMLLPDAPPPVVEDPTRPALFLRAVATHEAGHLIGLAHDCGTGMEQWPTDGSGLGVEACDTASNEVVAATMFVAVGPLDDGPSTLEGADVAGACAIAATQTCEQEVLGGCSAAPIVLGREGRTPLAPVLLSVGIVGLFARRRGRGRRA